MSAASPCGPMNCTTCSNTSDWGLSGFAAQYAFGWKDVEAEASARAAAYVAWYRERKGTN